MGRRIEGSDSARKPDDDVALANLPARRRFGKAGDFNGLCRNVRKMPVRFVEKMMVVGPVRIEIAARRIEADLAQKARAREGVQIVIDGRQREAHPPFLSLFMNLFSGQMFVLAVEKDGGEQKPLPRRANAGRLKKGREFFFVISGAHSFIIDDKTDFVKKNKNNETKARPSDATRSRIRSSPFLNDHRALPSFVSVFFAGKCRRRRAARKGLSKNASIA
jgi:hypothetical protein